MNKTYVGIFVAILLVFGGGYLLSNGGDKPAPAPVVNTSNTADTPKTDTSGGTLDLSNKQLTELPSSVLNRTDITTLNLSNNQLASLPAGISTLTNLEILNVENNRLVSLPPELAELKKLREIHANNNRMTDLPVEIDGMSGLRLLDISGNNIPASRIEQLKAKLTSAEIKS